MEKKRTWMWKEDKKNVIKMKSIRTKTKRRQAGSGRQEGRGGGGLED